MSNPLPLEEIKGSHSCLTHVTLIQPQMPAGTQTRMLCQTLNFSPRAREDGKQSQSGQQAAGQCGVQGLPGCCAHKGEDRPQQPGKSRPPARPSVRPGLWSKPAGRGSRCYWLFPAGTSKWLQRQRRAKLPLFTGTPEVSHCAIVHPLSAGSSLTDQYTQHRKPQPPRGPSLFRHPASCLAVP